MKNSNPSSRDPPSGARVAITRALVVSPFSPEAENGEPTIHVPRGIDHDVGPRTDPCVCRRRHSAGARCGGGGHGGTILLYNLESRDYRRRQERHLGPRGLRGVHRGQGRRRRPEQLRRSHSESREVQRRDLRSYGGDRDTVFLALTDRGDKTLPCRGVRRAAHRMRSERCSEAEGALADVVQNRSPSFMTDRSDCAPFSVNVRAVSAANGGTA